MKLGIVGLPNVGKSTLFNAITSTKNAEAANYPFCTIEPNSGIVAVPDKRLDKLAEIWQTNKKTPAIVEFVDIAGLVKGASQGAGLGNKFLGHIRECDAIVHVVRCFDDDNIIHVVEDVTKAEAVDPISDIDAIDYELILSDLEVGEDQLIVDGVDVRDGVHGLGLGHILHDMDDVVVVKATHHMDDGVALADVAEEFVAEACALTCALHEARDVHELHDGRGLFVGLPDLSQLVQPLVGHGHDAAVRLDGAEGIVCGLRVLGGGDGIEQSGLADVGQADDTKFHIKYAPSRLIDILIHLSLYAKERRSARVNPSVCSDSGRSSPPRSRAAPPPR